MGECGVEKREGAPVVDPHDAAGLGGADVAHAAGGHDAGAVHDPVQARGLREEFADERLVGDVADDRAHARVRGVARVECLADIGGDDLGARLAQPLHCAGADPACRARDQGVFDAHQRITGTSSRGTCRSVKKSGSGFLR